MKEYEYSFEVKDVKPYVAYCESNGYLKVSSTSQQRTLYRNKHGIMARITTIKSDEADATLLDFKDDNDSKEILKVSRETIPLIVNTENEKAITSILEILEFKKDKVLVRDRIVFEKDEVTFEIDEYTSPKVMSVVAVEGNKAQVDKVYDEIKIIKI